MSTIHLHQTTSSTPEQYVAGLTDFGPGRRDRLDYLDAAFRGDYFPGCRLERRAGGEPQRGASPCLDKLSVSSAIPDTRPTSVPYG
jgi:hypothetical protein